MADIAPNSPVDPCGDSGALDGHCLASHNAEKHDIEFDSGVLDDEFAEDGVGTTFYQRMKHDCDTDIFDIRVDVESMLDATSVFAEPPGFGKIELPDHDLDPETELEELRKQHFLIEQRIGVLESLVTSGLAGPKQPEAEQQGNGKRRCPVTTDDVLQMLQTSHLLNPKQLQAVKLLTTDARVFVRQLLAAQFLTEWQADQLLGGRTSFLLGKNRLLRLIGVGTSGVVLLAEHITMNRRVALKILSRRLSQDKAALNSFLSQGRVLAELNHRNIVRAYNVDQANDRYYLVMEYVCGQNLESIVGAKGPLEFPIAANFICQAAKGLHHGHTHDIVHGNVRPSNLLLDSEGTIKIAYTGCTGNIKEGNGAASGSNGDRMVNSIDYLAPEYVGGNGIDARTDIYSLGCTLYFLLTGHPPFPEGLFSEKLEKHQRAQPESIRTFRPDVPELLVEVCNKMMAKNPEDRFQTCQDVAEALQPLAGPRLTGESIAELLQSHEADLPRLAPGAANSKSNRSRPRKEAKSTAKINPDNGLPHNRGIRFASGSRSDGRRYGELVPVDGSDPIPLQRPVLLVGQRECCDIVLRSSGVSGRHAQLTATDGSWHVEDFNSANGTYVNGTQTERQRLVPGDVVAFGKEKYTINYEPDTLRVE